MPARATNGAATRARATRAGTKRRGGARAQAAKKPSTLGSVATAVRGTAAAAVAAVARTVTRRPSTDAIVLLETDHRRMEGLLKRGEQTTGRAITRRRDLLNAITEELNAHEMIEEKIFYPTLESHPEAKDLVLEGFEEHHAANLLVAELHEVAADNEQWGAKFKVLQETIQHHIDEEEGGMFRTARAVLSQDELEALGRQMAKLKAQTRH